MKRSLSLFLLVVVVFFVVAVFYACGNFVALNHHLMFLCLFLAGCLHKKCVRFVICILFKTGWPQTRTRRWVTWMNPPHLQITTLSWASLGMTFEGTKLAPLVQWEGGISTYSFVAPAPPFWLHTVQLRVCLFWVLFLSRASGTLLSELSSVDRLSAFGLVVSKESSSRVGSNTTESSLSAGWLLPLHTIQLQAGLFCECSSWAGWQKCHPLMILHQLMDYLYLAWWHLEYHPAE